MDLQEIRDRIEIADVLTRYTRAIDTGDWDKLDTVFTPDASIDYSESGGIIASYPEIKPWLAEMLPMFFSKRMHMLGQIEVDLHGDEAEYDDPRNSFLNEVLDRRTGQLHEECVWRRNI